MARAPLTLVACALAALAILPAGATAQAPAQLRGVQMPIAQAGQNSNDVDLLLDRIDAMGANSVRVEARWYNLEPRSARTYDEQLLAALDEQVEGAAKRGLKVVLLVLGSPCWSTTGPNKNCPGGEFAAAYPPSDAADYGRFAAFLAERYAGKLAAIEVWNEPDQANEIYWKASDKPGAYAKLLKAAYPIIKRAAPSVPVLAGSLVGGDGKFLRALYKAGIKGSYDGLSVHYYDLVLASLRSIRDVQRANRDTKPVYLAEFGWTSCYRPGRVKQGGQICVTKQKQAQSLSDVLRAIRKISWIKAALIYQVQDNDQYDFGLLDRDGAPKPAYNALKPLLVGGIPPSRAMKVRAAVRNGQVVATGDTPAGDVVDIVARSSKFRYKVTVKPTRENAFRVSIPRQLGTKVSVTATHRWTGRSATART